MKVIDTQTGRICKDVAGFHLIHCKKILIFDSTENGGYRILCHRVLQSEAQ